MSKEHTPFIPGATYERIGKDGEGTGVFATLHTTEASRGLLFTFNEGQVLVSKDHTSLDQYRLVPGYHDLLVRIEALEARVASMDVMARAPKPSSRATGRRKAT